MAIPKVNPSNDGNDQCRGETIEDKVIVPGMHAGAVGGEQSLRGHFKIGYQACSSSSNVLASFRSCVSKPSVNQP
jgi:hypothetical protein